MIRAGPSFAHENITTGGVNPVEIRAFCAQTKSSKVMTYSVIDWHDVPFGWIVFAFFLWTGLAHLVYVTILWTRYKDSLEEGRRWTLRWVEYAVSASLMYFLILYFFGITNSIVLIVMSVAVFCVILSPAVVKSKTAMILVAVIYATVWLYPFIRLFAENWDTLGQITWFVWLILLGEFVLFNLFPVVYLFENKRIHDDLSLYGTDTAYNVLSMVSKLLLGLILGFFVFM
jgi:hypothetical protein